MSKSTPEQSRADLKAEIEAAWEARDGVNVSTRGPVRDAVKETLRLLDSGEIRCAERGGGGAWTVHQWAKQAILLSFRLRPNELMKAHVPGPFFDKVPGNWDRSKMNKPEDVAEVVWQTYNAPLGTNVDDVDVPPPK